MTFTTYASLSEATTHLTEVLAHQETLLDPEFDPVLDDLEREFAELRVAIRRDLN